MQGPTTEGDLTKKLIQKFKLNAICNPYLLSMLFISITWSRSACNRRANCSTVVGSLVGKIPMWSPVSYLNIVNKSSILLYESCVLNPIGNFNLNVSARSIRAALVQLTINDNFAQVRVLVIADIASVLFIMLRRPTRNVIYINVGNSRIWSFISLQLEFALTNNRTRLI